ncbi:MAG TPA: hypothetical protein EYQ57_06145 [Methylococcaceae bacterium]|jgi:hypothetical protein|nr:hypothetical protein [Methylococcaceae bacterium]
MGPPFHTWLITNIGRLLILKQSPNDDENMKEMRLFTLGGRRHFEDFQFYLTKEEDINLLMVQPEKYLEMFSDEITTWRRE